MLMDLLVRSCHARIVLQFGVPLRRSQIDVEFVAAFLRSLYSRLQDLFSFVSKYMLINIQLLQIYSEFEVAELEPAKSHWSQWPVPAS